MIEKQSQKIEKRHLISRATSAGVNFSFFFFLFFSYVATRRPTPRHPFEPNFRPLFVGSRRRAGSMKRKQQGKEGKFDGKLSTYSKADNRILEKYSLASFACLSCHSFSHWATFSWISFSLVRPFFRARAEKLASLADVFAFSGCFFR